MGMVQDPDHAGGGPFRRRRRRLRAPKDRQPQGPSRDRCRRRPPHRARRARRAPAAAPANARAASLRCPMPGRSDRARAWGRTRAPSSPPPVLTRIGGCRYASRLGLPPPRTAPRSPARTAPPAPVGRRRPGPSRRPSRAAGDDRRACRRSDRPHRRGARQAASVVRGFLRQPAIAGAPARSRSRSSTAMSASLTGESPAPFVHASVRRKSSAISPASRPPRRSGRDLGSSPLSRRQWSCPPRRVGALVPKRNSRSFAGPATEHVGR